MNIDECAKVSMVLAVLFILMFASLTRFFTARMLELSQNKHNYDDSVAACHCRELALRFWWLTILSGLVFVAAAAVHFWEVW